MTKACILVAAASDKATQTTHQASFLKVVILKKTSINQIQTINFSSKDKGVVCTRRKILKVLTRESRWTGNLTQEKKVNRVMVHSPINRGKDKHQTTREC
jgi:hypothetical protein